MSFQLRKHQSEVTEICKRIVAGEPINEILCAVTPGGGKSALPVILADMLIPAIADKILWIVPRNSLKYQGEEEFCEKHWNTNHRLRAVNENHHHPSRGFSGYITTYQAIGVNPCIHWDEIENHRYIVFYDEIHHASELSSWERALLPIVENSVLNVYGSGTLYRGDGKKISFMDYEGSFISTKKSESREVVIYTRSDAIKDGAILPTYFKTIDGRTEWEELDGSAGSAQLSESGRESNKALFTALRTEYAYELLDYATGEWATFRKQNLRNSALIIVAHDIEQAKMYMKYMSLNFPQHSGDIATSNDSIQAREAIDKYKRGVLSYLVTVAMAYEGLSVKQITHIACLTHIRSIPWLDQLFARGNRLYPEKHCAWIYGPADPEFLEAIVTIEQEQLIPISDDGFMSGESSEAGEGGGQRRWINPLKSEADIEHDFDLNGYASGIPISKQESELRSIIRRMKNHHLNNARAGAQKTRRRVMDRTIRATVDKSLKEMTLNELMRVHTMMRDRFPV
jgi:superfamily II DNA or RNA helicase